MAKLQGIAKVSVSRLGRVFIQSGNPTKYLLYSVIYRVRLRGEREREERKASVRKQEAICKGTEAGEEESISTVPTASSRGVGSVFRVLQGQPHPVTDRRSEQHKTFPKNENTLSLPMQLRKMFTGTLEVR